MPGFFVLGVRKQLGTWGRNRTGTGVTPPEFESGASTSFATQALEEADDLLAAGGAMLPEGGL